MMSERIKARLDTGTDITVGNWIGCNGNLHNCVISQVSNDGDKVHHLPHVLLACWWVVMVRACPTY